jgi:hypothetical protein
MYFVVSEDQYMALRIVHKLLKLSSRTNISLLNAKSPSI